MLYRDPRLLPLIVSTPPRHRLRSSREAVRASIPRYAATSPRLLPGWTSNSRTIACCVVSIAADSWDGGLLGLVPPERQGWLAVSDAADGNGVGGAKRSAEAINRRSEFRMLSTHVLPVGG